MERVGLHPLARTDLHRALFEPHWDDIVTGKLSLEEKLKSVLADIAPDLSPHRLLMESLGLDRYCDGIFYSAALSCRKPSTHFYEKVPELSGFRPAQLLLIDDTPANVLAARNLGWNAVEWTKSSTLAEQISKLQMAVRYIW